MIRIRTASGYEIVGHDVTAVMQSLHNVLIEQLSSNLNVKSANFDLEADELTLRLEVQANSWAEAEIVTNAFINRALTEVQMRLGHPDQIRDSEFLARGTELALA